MLTYTPTPPRTDTAHREYPWALLLLVCVWLLPGVFSHDLWKPTEPQLYTAIQESVHGSWWLPTLYGQAYFDAPPFYVQAALAWQRWLSPTLTDAYTAARFASVMFTVIGLLGSGMAGYRFLGRHHGRSVVLILIGSFGMLPIGHFLDTKSMLFASVGLALWGYSVAHRQVVFSAVLVGLGTTLLIQSAGILFAASVLFTGYFALLHPLWRNNRFKVALISITAITLPLAAIYPLALLIGHPNAFPTYWQHYLYGVFGGTHTFQAAFSLPYYFKNLIWFAFPALPLALWTLLHGKWRQHTASIFCLTWLSVFGLLLTLSPKRDQDLLVLILPVLAILGAAQLDNLRRGAAAFLNWFGIMTFGLAAVFLWLGFFAMNYGFPAKLAERAAYFSPYYTRDIDIMPMLTAIICTPVWLLAITRKRIRARQAITNWAAGTTLVWALLMTLFLPWIDAVKSHRPLVQQMINALPENTRAALQNGDECLFISPQNIDARIAWQQYSSLPFHSDNSTCRYILAQFHPQQQTIPNTGTILWQGHRPRNKRHEQFVLLDTRPTVSGSLKTKVQP